jgi:hypothetical protein
LDKPLGKHGMMFGRYLKDHWSYIYQTMLMDGKLFSRLEEVALNELIYN